MSCKHLVRTLLQDNFVSVVFRSNRTLTLESTRDVTHTGSGRPAAPGREDPRPAPAKVRWPVRHPRHPRGNLLPRDRAPASSNCNDRGPPAPAAAAIDEPRCPPHSSIERSRLSGQQRSLSGVKTYGIRRIEGSPGQVLTFQTGRLRIPETSSLSRRTRRNQHLAERTTTQGQEER